MPDFDRRSSASFISSKEGGTPDSFSRSLMNRRSSYCLRVSISTSPQVAVVRFPRRPTLRLPAERPTPPNVIKVQKQIMNEHYLFHMCSATTYFFVNESC